MDQIRSVDGKGTPRVLVWETGYSKGAERMLVKVLEVFTERTRVNAADPLVHYVLG